MLRVGKPKLRTSYLENRKVLDSSLISDTRLDIERNDTTSRVKERNKRVKIQNFEWYNTKLIKLQFYNIYNIKIQKRKLRVKARGWYNNNNSSGYKTRASR